MDVKKKTIQVQVKDFRGTVRENILISAEKDAIKYHLEQYLQGIVTENVTVIQSERMQ